MYSPPLAALPAASAPAREAKGTDMRKERLFITHLKRAEVFHNSTLSFQRRKLSIRHFGFPIQRVPGVLSCHSWVGKADSGESRRLGLGWSVLERLSWRWALSSGIGARYRREPTTSCRGHESQIGRAPAGARAWMY